jgi:hypothetical protein
MEMVHDRCSTLLTEFGTALTTILNILFQYCYNYCYSDSRSLYKKTKSVQQPENCENCNDLGTGISKEIAGCIRFEGTKSPAFITAQRLRLSL